MDVSYSQNTSFYTIYVHCTVDSISFLYCRYDVVAKMESFAEDTQFILEEAGLKDVLEVEWKHRTGREQGTGREHGDREAAR